MSGRGAHPATDSAYALAEGPVWDPSTATVRWVDMVGGRILSGVIEGTRLRVVTDEQRQGLQAAALPSDDGGRLVVEGDRAVRLAQDGRVLWAEPLPLPAPAARANDAACDPQGRLLYGTKGKGPQSLYRREHDGSFTVLDDDLTLSNGIAWSPDGSVLYHADTLAGTVWRRTYDGHSGRVGPRTPQIDLAGAWPDGIAVDEEGDVWVAVWGAGEVRRYGAAGDLRHTVPVPAPHTSSVCFAGERRDVLVITTARDGLSVGDRERWPDSGRLFLVEAPVAGVPETPFRTDGHG